jgi:hypothetical protein
MTDETSMTGEGNQPEGTGWVAPDQGQGEDAESEIPIGVDQIEHTASDDDGEEGGSAPIDLANLDVGDAEPTAEGDADADADAEGEPAAAAEAEPAAE